MAYFCVHSRAILLNPARSDLNFLAISGTRGSSGFGSVRREHIESNTLEMVNAGLEEIERAKWNGIFLSVVIYIYVCVCVAERERGRDRESSVAANKKATRRAKHAVAVLAGENKKMKKIYN